MKQEGRQVQEKKGKALPKKAVSEKVHVKSKGSEIDVLKKCGMEIYASNKSVGECRIENNSRQEISLEPKRVENNEQPDIIDMAIGMSGIMNVPHIQIHEDKIDQT